MLWGGLFSPRGDLRSALAVRLECRAGLGVPRRLRACPTKTVTIFSETQ